MTSNDPHRSYPLSRTRLSSRLGKALHLLAANLIVLFVGTTTAQAQLSIASNPLFVTLPVTPSVILAVDDSGSMDSEILMRSNDGAAWWNTSNKSFTGLNQADQPQAGAINFNIAGTANSTWKKFVYLFPNGTGQTSGRRAYRDSTNDHFAVPPFDEFAHVRSPAYNRSYFNPVSTYEPWPNAGGYTFTDSNPANARTDPTRGNEIFNLTVAQLETDTDHVFRVFPGMRISAGVRYRDWDDGVWKTAPVGGRLIVNADMPDSCGAACTYGGGGRGVPVEYFPATFYLPASKPLPAAYGYIGLPLPTGIAPDGTPMTRYEIKPGNFSTPVAYTAAIQSFANWFTYYRKRHASSRGGIGTAFRDVRGFRLGSYRINSRPSPASNLPIRDLSNNADRNAFFGDVYQNFLGTGGTPNREAVNSMRSQFSRSDANAPIQYACQKNFGVLFTDGYANAWTGAGVGNRDGGAPTPFSDTASNTMADIGMALFGDNPRPGMPAGKVPVPAACNVANPDPRLDCNTNLHANLFAVTLGTPGAIFNVDPAATADPYANPPAWPTNFPNRNPAHVDDLWHATLNARGELLDVSVPAELGQRFSQVLTTLAERVTSGSAVASNSTRLDTETRIYQARFNTEDWTGQLLAYTILPDGTLGAIQWDAGQLIPAANSRDIFTRTSAGSAVPFDWASLGAAEQAALDIGPGGVADGLGEKRLEWLRGDQILEQSAGGPFRTRNVILGDTISSNPRFVGAENFGYTALPAGTPGQDSYASFLQSRVNITGAAQAPMLYVGANDGMLHGFDAATGVEHFAYVPQSMYSKLSRLTNPNYAHEYFVDGQIFVGDAYINRNGTQRWASVLVSTTGAGARSVFALDVTNPHGFSATDVLWEFTDPDLGYTIGQPIVARMASGQWVTVFGNGYNSDNHRAVLFVVDLETGTLIKKIDTGIGSAASPNGLATPALLPDGTRTIRAVYAGDLHGNLWKFDVSQSNSGNWDIAFSQGQTDYPLFTATNAGGIAQPITAPLEIGQHPDGGYMIYFGSGKYFETTDNSVPANPQVQTFYGIWDQTGNNASRISAARATALQEQTIQFEGNPGGGSAFNVRVTSANPVDWNTKRGWFLDLVSPVNGAEGERVVDTPLLRGGRVIFTTLIPSGDPCSAGGTSWLMEMDAINGRRLLESPLDINEDGEIDVNDFVSAIVDGQYENVPISGVQSREGIVRTPAVISAGEVEYKITSGTTGAVDTLRETGAFQQARASWRQLR